jgi:hypothetical protein
VTKKLFEFHARRLGFKQHEKPAVPEAAVALEETFVHEVHQRVGLRFRTIRRGGWWHGDGRHHDVLAAVPDRATPAQSPHSAHLP